MVISHSYVSLPDGNIKAPTSCETTQKPWYHDIWSNISCTENEDLKPQRCKTFAWLKHPQVSPNQHKYHKCALRFNLRHDPRKIASEIPEKWPVKGFQDVGSTTFVDGFWIIFSPAWINCQVDPPWPILIPWHALLCSLVTQVYSFIPIMSLWYISICYIYIYVSYIIMYIYIYVYVYIRYMIYYIIISLY